MGSVLLRFILFGCRGFISFAINVQDPVPLTEYYSRTLKDYKGLAWNEITPDNAAPMIRVRKLQDAEFKDLVRRGYPFIVDDCAEHAQLKDMPCSEYGRRWPKEHMRAEYTADQHHIFLEESDWHSVQKPQVKAPKHLSRGKDLSGPYIWHVKDETDDPKTKPDIQKIFDVPYFLNSSGLNRNEARDSFEFWYVLENGGSQAHADAYCETTISLQLRGTKQWRLGAFPNITNAFQPHSFHDADIYRHDHFWRPEHEEKVEPGQCVVFPMGYIHETYIAEGDGGDDGCSVATTFQFQDPQPVFLWKNFLARWGLSHYTREEPCLERMAPYVFLGHRMGLQGTKGRNEQLMRDKSKELFKTVDKNGDGYVSREELGAEYAKERFRPPWTHAKSPTVLKEAAEEKVRWMAEDAVLYHDDDGDGMISSEEFEASVLKFMAVRNRANVIKKTKGRSALLEKEKEWIKEHICISDDCPQLVEMESHFKKRMKKTEL